MFHCIIFAGKWVHALMHLVFSPNVQQTIHQICSCQFTNLSQSAHSFAFDVKMRCSYTLLVYPSLIIYQACYYIFRPNRPLTPTTDGLVRQGAHVPAFGDDLPGWFCTKNEDGKSSNVVLFNTVEGYNKIVIFTYKCMYRTCTPWSNLKCQLHRNLVFCNTNKNTVSVVYYCNYKLSQNLWYLLSLWNLILNTKDLHITIYSQLCNSQFSYNYFTRI